MREIHKRDFIQGMKKLCGKVHITGEAFLQEEHDSWTSAQLNPQVMQRLTRQQQIERSNASSSNTDVSNVVAVQPPQAVQDRNTSIFDLSHVAAANPAATFTTSSDLKALCNCQHDSEYPVSLSRLVHSLNGIADKEDNKNGRVFAKSSTYTKFKQIHNVCAFPGPKLNVAMDDEPNWIATARGCQEYRTRCEDKLKKFITMCLLPNKPASLFSAKMLLKLVMTDIVGIEAIHASGNSQAGAVPFRANFVRLEEIDNVEACPELVDVHLEMSANDKLLKHSRSEFINTLRKLPFGGDVSVGMLDHYTVKDICGYVVNEQIVSVSVEHWNVVSLVLGDFFICRGGPNISQIVVLAEKDEGEPADVTADADDEGDVDWSIVGRKNAERVQHPLHRILILP